jgi:hypothetical protein
MYNVYMSLFNLYKKTIDDSFDNAENHISKLTPELLSMNGMSGIKTRHFYNNMCSMEGTRYLEIGTWMGSSTSAAMYGNKSSITCIDNWCELWGGINNIKELFLDNFNKYKGNNDARYIESDCFKLDISTLPKFNMYLYDGNHAENNHILALTHYISAMDDIFIFIVDDWNGAQEQSGTRIAIKQLDLTVLYEREIITPSQDSDTWWAGIYVAILQKKK